MTTYRTNWDYVKACAGMLSYDERGNVVGVSPAKPTRANIAVATKRATPEIERSTGMKIDRVDLV